MLAGNNVNNQTRRSNRHCSVDWLDEITAIHNYNWELPRCLARTMTLFGAAIWSTLFGKWRCWSWGTIIGNSWLGNGCWSQGTASRGRLICTRFDRISKKSSSSTSFYAFSLQVLRCCFRASFSWTISDCTHCLANGEIECEKNAAGQQ